LHLRQSFTGEMGVAALDVLLEQSGWVC
jgi:hypothetical protein